MKISTARIGAAAALALALSLPISGNVWADRGHHGHFHGSVGVFIGDPFWPWYYPPYPYYYPPVVAVPSAPPVYIEQGGGAEAPAGPSYWYYCDRPQGYYPYVKECPGGWKRVAPTPPPS